MAKECAAKVTVVNRLGLHARPATAVADLAQQFTSAISLRRDEEEIDGKSIMQIMLLAATQGVELEVIARGDDADAACQALADLFARGFDEE
ncbi:MAG: HPr family phosphocarrier protein [Phycisphaerales bacterium]|nr:HPr family phosphocarrier protein [Phycisphaerales bacterium]